MVNGRQYLFKIAYLKSRFGTGREVAHEAKRVVGRDVVFRGAAPGIPFGIDMKTHLEQVAAFIKLQPVVFQREAVFRYFLLDGDQLGKSGLATKENRYFLDGLRRGIMLER